MQSLNLQYDEISSISANVLSIPSALSHIPSSRIPGLFVGCALANLIGLALGATGVIDVFIGSAATLIAAILTYKLREKRLIALIPPVVVNALLVGLELTIMLDMPFYITAPCVAAGEFVACYVLGYTISLVVDKYMKKVF